MNQFVSNPVGDDELRDEVRDDYEGQPEVIAKLDRLEEIDRERSAANEARHTHRLKLSEDVSDLSSQIAHFDRSIAASGLRVDPKDEKRRERLATKLAAARAKLAEFASAKSDPAFTPDSGYAFLARNRDKQFRHFAPSDWGDIPKTTPPAKALAMVRTAIVTQADAIKEVKQRPLPLADALAKFEAGVNRRASRGKMNAIPNARMSAIDLTGVKQGSTRWPHTTDIVAGESVTSDAGLDFAIWLHKDAILARGKEQITNYLKDKQPLSRQERAERIQELESELLRLERIEESIVMACEAANIPVLRRPRAAPAAVLEIREVESTDEDDVDFG